MYQSSTCEFDPCSDTVYATGLCAHHYVRKQRGLELKPIKTRKPRVPCGFEGCDRQAWGQGLCSPHFLQKRRGFELKPLQIKWDNLLDKMLYYLHPDENECWIWQLSMTSHGYGRVRWKGKDFQVHRQLWLEIVGPIEDGLELDHLCRVTACANPDHLEPVTHRENLLRGFGASGVNARKTHCSHGHPFNEENTRIYRGSRRCITCQNEWNAKR